MSIKGIDIDNKNIVQLWEYILQAFTSKVKPDETRFAQNRIFLLIITIIWASITISHFLFFTAVTFCLL